MAKDVRKMIIEISYRLFQENGYDSTTVNDICSACNITKTTFYRYLESKEDILTYFFEDLGDELNDLIIKMASSDSYWEQIIFVYDLIENRIKVFGRELYSQLYITNLKEYRGTFDEVGSLKELVILLIKKGQDSGQIGNCSDPAELYDICTNIFFGCCIRWSLGLTDRTVHDEYIRCMASALQIK